MDLKTNLCHILGSSCMCTRQGVAAWCEIMFPKTEKKRDTRKIIVSIINNYKQ
jgi:hypothetical protein